MRKGSFGNKALESQRRIASEFAPALAFAKHLEPCSSPNEC